MEMSNDSHSQITTKKDMLVLPLKFTSKWCCCEPHVLLHLECVVATVSHTHINKRIGAFNIACDAMVETVSGCRLVFDFVLFSLQQASVNSKEPQHAVTSALSSSKHKMWTQKLDFMELIFFKNQHIVKYFNKLEHTDVLWCTGVLCLTFLSWW